MTVKKKTIISQQNRPPDVMAAPLPPSHAPSYAYSNYHFARTSTNTIYTRTVSPHYVSSNAWSMCCYRRRPSCTIYTGMDVPQNVCACVSSLRRIGRSDDRTPDTGTASPRNGYVRGRSNWPPAKRTCCSRCNGTVSRQNGCASGSLGCWGGRNSFLTGNIQLLRQTLNTRS